MIFGIGNEAGIFAYALLTGVSALCAYRILSCLRRIVPHSMAAVGIEDMAFWIAASIYIFRRMYETTYGSIRWFFVLGVVCGAFLCHALMRVLFKVMKKTEKRLEKYKKSR